MRPTRRAILAGAAASPFAAVVASNPEVTIFEARRIVTMEKGMPQARFMAVAGGLILGLADRAEDLEVWSRGGRTKRNTDFTGKVLFPGLVDPHIHPMQAAIMLGLPFLAPDDWHLPSGFWPGVTGKSAYIARLKEIIGKTEGEPLIVWGHHELFHGEMSKTLLDEIAPDRPVMVWQRSFHDLYANSAALRWMKLDSERSFNTAIAAAKADPAHADFAKGKFSETSLPVAIAKLRPVLLSPDKLSSGFAGLLTMMRQRGVTTTSDLATGIFAAFELEAGLIANAFSPAGAGARVNLMPMATSLDAVEDVDRWMDQSRSAFERKNVMMLHRVKLLADGAFFAQNMQMSPPGYTDGHHGKWITEPETLNAQMQKYWNKGFSLHIHVNGDAGAETVLEGLEKLPPKNGQDIVLEHLGYCTAAQLRRISRLGIMVSAQPNYIRVLGEAYGRSGFGPDRAALINRLGSLERLNIPLGLHSDFNMAPIDPFYLAWIAQSREGLDGISRAPEEKVSREKALRAITIEAAQVIGLDHMIGSLAAGKKADFIALDEDPFEMALTDMKEVKIHATCFEGRQL